MVDFKINVNDTKNGNSYKITVSGSYANFLIGKRIGDEVDGMFVNLPGYKLIITGGSDHCGFPMRRDLPGSRRRKILLTRGKGLRTTKGGLRKRKSIRGNTISEDISIISMMVTTYGSRDLKEALLGEVSKSEEPQT